MLRQNFELSHKEFELLWMKIILDYLRVKYEAHMKMFCDKKSAISNAHNLAT